MRRLIALYASKKSKIIVAQMFSKTLTNRKNNEIKEILKKLPDLQIYLEFPAKLMGKRRHLRDRYELLEEF